MSFLILLFALGFIAFALYAGLTHFKNTTGTVKARVIAAMSLAAASLLAALQTWLHSATAP